MARRFIYALSSKGITDLKAFCGKDVLFAFDFDGTLAPLRKKPKIAKMSKTMALKITKLKALAPVAIVSGRGRADLMKKLVLRTPYMVGNHGWEGAPIPKVLLKRARASVHCWKRPLKKGIEEHAIDADLEDKTLSLSLHYRHARRKREVIEKLLELIAQLEPKPRVILGKCVVNLIPNEKIDKGTAIKSLLKVARVKHAFFIGDDHTDDVVFRVAFPKSQWFTVRVGRDPNSHAQYFVRNITEVEELLQLLIRFTALRRFAGASYRSTR